MNNLRTCIMVLISLTAEILFLANQFGDPVVWRPIRPFCDLRKKRS